MNHPVLSFRRNKRHAAVCCLVSTALAASALFMGQSARAQTTVNTTQTISTTTSTGALLIGDGGTGNLTVTGSGTTVTAYHTGGDTDAPYAGLALGVKNSTDSGTLTLSAGAKLNATYNVLIGKAGTGMVTVTGAGSTLTALNNGHYEIGSAANTTGTLNVLSGGVVNINTDNSTTNTSNASVFATGSGSTATVLVDGAGSSFSESNSGYGAVYLSNGGTSTITLSNGGNFTTGQNLYFSGTPGGSGVASNGGGSTINIGSATLTAPTTGGTLTVGGTLTNAGTGTGTLNFNQTNAFTFTSNIVGVSGAGAISINQLGTGTSTLSGTNSFTGALTVSAGTLILAGNDSGRPVNAVTTVNNGGTLQLQANTGNTTSGTSTALSQEATGGFPLSLKNGSTLQLRSDSDVTFAGGNGFGGLGNATVNFDVNQLTSAGTAHTLTFAPGGFGSQNDTFNVTGGNGYTLKLGSDSSYGGTFTLNANTANAQIGNISATVGVTVGGAANTLVTGVINNGAAAATLTKNGAGTLTLGGTNTYTGATAVNGGVLLVNGSTATGSAVTVGNGTTLNGTLGGTGTAGGSVNVKSGSTVMPGSGQAVGTLTTGALTLQSTSTFNAFLASDSSVSQLMASTTTITSGALFSITLPAGADFTNADAGTPDVLTLIPSGVTGTFSNGSYTAGGYTFTADYATTMGGFDVDVTPVPEPATWAAGILCLAALGYRQRRGLNGLFEGRSICAR